jgi:hypothetical protein
MTHQVGQREGTPPIGQLALVHRKPSVREVMEVLDHDPDRSALFGKVAGKRGFLDGDESNTALTQYLRSAWAR